MADLAMTVVAFLAAMVLTAGWRAVSTHYVLLAIPNQRSSHQRPTATGAGVAIIATFLPLVLVLYARDDLPGRLVVTLAAGGLLLGIVGLIDDLREVAPRWRMLAHVAAAASAVAAIGAPAELADLSMSPLWRWGLAGLTVLGVIWHINLFNFMDGIDGIAGSQAVFVATTGALLSAAGGEPGLNACLYGLAGAVAGFLVWNWPPAKVFMGDSGSGFLGFVLACCALYSTARGLLSLWSWLILMSAFLADATTTLVRRASRGEKLSQAHRSHAYQVCARRLGGHRRVTLAFTLINVLWLLPLAATAAHYPAQGPLMAAIAILPLSLLAALLGAGQPERQSDGSGPGYPKPQ